jgi:hypothetical protein
MNTKSSALVTSLAQPARRGFLKGLGTMGLGASFVSLVGGTKMFAALSSGAAMDTANQIFQAAVIAEDLATTFYYNGLVGSVITNENLAGPGGTATSGTGNVPNVDYLRAALNQEIEHANLLRAVGNFGASYTADPFQTFYFAPATFTNINTFIATLSALENAFIGAYLNAIREFASLASRSNENGVPDGPFGGPYSAAQLEWFAEVAASIMGVECEHRVLGPVILNANQPNNLYFESTDTLTSVYHGSNSAVAALTPFLSQQNGTVGFSLAAAVNGASNVGLASSGSYPAY